MKVSSRLQKYRMLLVCAAYTKEERPVLDHELPVELTFGLELRQIIDLDEKKQVLTTNMWLNLQWTDYNLLWNKVNVHRKEHVGSVLSCWVQALCPKLPTISSSYLLAF